MKELHWASKIYYPYQYLTVRPQQNEGHNALDIMYSKIRIWIQLDNSINLDLESGTRKATKPHKTEEIKNLHA
jgi:hypothetical protein